ncbi:helix-turn-helix transcriptional regulator [Pseudomonas sp. GL-RE-29]|jgi:LuxR family quorum-sensing transcriptional regulator LasR|uniref:helix-turn-helix transcriptional regulator n=1 Tax=Pseudomonas sp. GL-RE-29 TaxID=2832375 RepID=UPI001CC17647|nr:LuxR family transcriptional regulator [Pseudomonas sp. GL-RE-29]
MNPRTPNTANARSTQPEYPAITAKTQPGIALTTREKEALLWSAKGKSSWEISRIFNCTEAGVNYHFSNIRRKFGVSSRWAAVMMALELGLIQLH